MSVGSGYLFVYDPSVGGRRLSYSPVCADGAIHVRLKADFDVVSGFEDKLTYLVTLLANAAYGSLSGSCRSFDEFASALSKSREFAMVMDAVREAFPEAAGIRIAPAIRSEGIGDGICLGDADEAALGELSRRFGAGGISEYLFDDGVYLMRRKRGMGIPDRNAKFARKALRKSKARSKAGPKIVRKSLWGM